MKNKLFRIIIVLFVIFVIGYAQNSFLGNYYIKAEFLSSIITFFSIIFGFYITSLAIFATSRYVSNLYQKVDINNPSLTLLNILLKKYKRGLTLLFFSILYLLVLHFIINQTDENKVLLSNYLLLPFLSVLVINFFYSYSMLVMLIKIIIQEAKNNEQ